MVSIQSVGEKIGIGIAKATNLKPAKWLGNKFDKNLDSALAAATVTSIVLKDGIGCAMYVTQSLNNKKIPDERRKFVAALDLTNGALMIGAQIAMFFAMRAYSGKLFKKIFHKSFNDVAKENIISRIRMLAAKAHEKVAKKLKIEKSYEEVEKSALGLFKFILDIGAATIVGKRVIVPLIATPMASKVEKWMNKDKNNEKNNCCPEPSMKGTNNQDTFIKVSDIETTNLLEKFKQQNNK